MASNNGYTVNKVLAGVTVASLIVLAGLTVIARDKTVIARDRKVTLDKCEVDKEYIINNKNIKDTINSIIISYYEQAWAVCNGRKFSEGSFEGVNSCKKAINIARELEHNTKMNKSGSEIKDLNDALNAASKKRR